MKNTAKRTLKSLKESAENYLKEENYTLSLSVCNQIKKEYPKNYFGYVGAIKSVTHNFKIYVPEDSIKMLKKDFEEAYNLSKKSEKEILKKEFDEYVEDCLEVESLKKTKKELVSKHFIKGLCNDGITYINQNINTAGTYNLNGKKITNVYDLIKGLFLFSCLIFNLIHRNYLLFLTIPFGIFGIITIYSFFSMNFFGKGKPKSEKERLSILVKEANAKIDELKVEINKLDESISFYTEQKNNNILKIPESFLTGIESYVNNDEESIASDILNELISNNISTFTYLINEYTSLTAEEVLLKIKPSIKDETSDLSKFIDGKLLERKNGQNEVILMKKVNPYSYVIIAFVSLISLFSIIVLLYNFYEINLTSFICAVVVGNLSIFIYNINTGKHGALTDTINDNLISCVFNATLVYDLVYTSITNELNFTYGFIQMPITFVLIFMGLASVVSLLKYNNLMTKLRGE